MKFIFICKVVIVVTLFSLLSEFLSLNKNDHVTLGSAKNEVQVSEQKIQDVSPKKEEPGQPEEPSSQKQAPVEYSYGNGNQYLHTYENVPAVRQILLVEQYADEPSAATLHLLVKENKIWKEVLQCEAFLGRDGIGKQREGDMRTPTGDYGFTMAFGILPDPGSLIPYTQLTNSMYVCGDEAYYNQFIDVNKVAHQCGSNSEHLIDYAPMYNYALFIDYNKDCVYGKGSGIFLHCYGSYRYTAGCVSVPESVMRKILQTVDSNSRICVYEH